MLSLILCLPQCHWSSLEHLESAWETTKNYLIQNLETNFFLYRGGKKSTHFSCFFKPLSESVWGGILALSCNLTTGGRMRFGKTKICLYFTVIDLNLTYTLPPVSAGNPKQYRHNYCRSNLKTACCGLGPVVNETPHSCSFTSPKQGGAENGLWVGIKSIS